MAPYDKRIHVCQHGASIKRWLRHRSQSALSIDAKNRSPKTPEFRSDIVNGSKGNVGGGEGMEGIYGSLTLNGMQSVVTSLQRFCGLKAESGFVDVGAGLGRPMMHLLVHPGLKKLWGIEVDGIKIQKACAFTRQLQQKLRNEGTISHAESIDLKITHSGIEEIPSLGDYTHVYSFWEGVLPEGKRALGRLCTECRSLQGLAVVQRAFRRCPESEMAKLGFHGFELKQVIRVRMSGPELEPLFLLDVDLGSGQMFNAYVFRKRSLPSRRATFHTPSTPKKTKHHPRASHGDVSVVRKSLLAMELVSPARSKSDVGCQGLSPNDL